MAFVGLIFILVDNCPIIVLAQEPFSMILHSIYLRVVYLPIRRALGRGRRNRVETSQCLPILLQMRHRNKSLVLDVGSRIMTFDLLIDSSGI